MMHWFSSFSKHLAFKCKEKNNGLLKTALVSFRKINLISKSKLKIIKAHWEMTNLTVLMSFIVNCAKG